MAEASDRRRHLPPSLNRLADIAGLEVALKLADCFGGIDLYISCDPARGGALIDAVGADAARKIVAAIGQGTLSIPHGRLSAMHDEIRRGLQAALTNREIARRAGCSMRTVRRHRRRVVIAAREK